MTRRGTSPRPTDAFAKAIFASLSRLRGRVGEGANRRTLGKGHASQP